MSMGTATPGSPLLVVAGTPTTIQSPLGGQGVGTTVSLVIYNNTPFILNVLGAGGAALLQPNQANLYQANLAAQVTVNAQVSTAIPNGTLLGTVQSSWFPGVISGAFPQPLIPFPGGSALMVPAQPGVFGPGAGLFTFGGGTNPGYMVPPPGTGGFSFYWLFNVIGNGSFTITGYVTGTVYATVTWVANNFTNPISLDLGPINPLDEVLVWEISGGISTLITVSNLYATPFGPAPTFPTAAVRNTTTGAALGAPTAGAWYLFSADLSPYNESAEAAVSYEGTTSGQNYIVLSCASDGNADHIDGPPIRVTEGITCNCAGGVQQAILRYAPGP